MPRFRGLVVTDHTIEVPLDHSEPDGRQIEDAVAAARELAGDKDVALMGGMAGLTATADDVYARTYPRAAAKNAAYLHRYPGDADRVRRIANHLRDTEVRLPDGDQLGLAFRYDLMGRTSWAATPFTGEMVYPWMFDQIASLRPYADTADLIAEATDWTPLYDVERLRVNQVPLACAIYHDDMYVDAQLSLGTTELVGNTATWISNEWEHDGVGASDGAVLDRLFKLGADLPRLRTPAD